jgi:hypothetical protein
MGPLGGPIHIAGAAAPKTSPTLFDYTIAAGMQSKTYVKKSAYSFAVL